MKILYLAFTDIALSKGPSVNEREFTYALNKVNPNTHFMMAKPSRGLEDLPPASQVTFLPNSKEMKLFPWLYQQLVFIFKAINLIRKNNYDVMIIRSGVFVLPILLVVWLTKQPYAVKTAGGGLFPVFKRKNFLIRMLYPLNQWLHKKYINGAICADVVSTTQKKSLEEVTGAYGKIYFVDNAVNADRFYPKDMKETRKALKLEGFDKIIGYTGGSPWERGGLQMVEAIPLLKEQFPNIGAIIVGGGNKMDVLYEKVKELGVEKHVVFTGVVPFEEVNDYINAFDVCISQRYVETQGASEMKVRQYIAAGKPVAVSPSPSNSFVEAEGLGAVVQDPYNIEEFSERVAELLARSEKEVSDFDIKARDYAENNLSMEARVHQRLQLYKESLHQ